MASDIDWNLHLARPTRPTVDTGGLGDVAQLVLGGLAQRRAHQQRQEQEAEERRRWEAENARKDAAERRAEALFQMQIEGRNEKTSGDIADLLGSGDVEGAQRRAATSNYIDPATGERSAIQFDRGGERFAPDMMPQARLSDPTEAEGSPLSPALKNAYPPIFGAGEKEAGGLELQGFAREMLGRMPEEGAPPAALPKRTVAPSFTVGGRRVEVDPNARTADLEQRSDRLRAATAGPGMPAGVSRMGDTLANLDLAEVDKADRASVVNALTQAQAQDARGDELDARLAMQEKLADKRRKKGGGGSGGGAPDMDARTVLDWEGNPIGLAPGKPDNSPEAREARKMLSTGQAINEEIDKIIGEVGTMGWMGRIPFLRNVDDTFQSVKGRSNTLVNPITNFLGGGAAQEAEAQRQMDLFAASAAKGPEAAKRGAENLKAFLRSRYEATARTLTAGQKSAGGAAPFVRPAAKPKKKFVMQNGKLMVEE